MSLTLTILLSLLSAGILAGRVYEILNLTDSATGFLLVNGIVMNPYVLGIFALITLCCGILIFGSHKTVRPYYSKSSKGTAIIAGAAFVAAGVPAMQFEPVAPFFIAGGAALIIMGIAGLGKKKTDIVVMILMLGFAAGMCMDVVSFDVSTYHNTVFLQRVLEYLCIAAFMLMTVKNVYLPSGYSRMMLYVTGMLSFAVCSMMNIANIICYVMTDGQSLYKMLMYVATALFGVFAFDTAVSAIPNKKEQKTISEEQQTEKYPEENVSGCEAVKDAESESAEAFAINELEKMFETIGEEKAENKQTDNKKDVYEAEEAVPEEETEENAIKHTMFSELFGPETEKHISPESHSILSETRSFKKFSQPKLDESAPEYDMLKSMFKGEDTSQYQFDTEKFEKEAKEQSQAKKKHSLFGRNKKEKSFEEKTLTEKPSAEKNATEQKNSSADIADKDKTKFSAAVPAAQRTKTETKKIVYKKPK